MKRLGLLVILTLLFGAIGIFYSKATEEVVFAEAEIELDVEICQADTCPDGNGWTKIDSDDLSLYPVEGAEEYCFKAGPFILDYIPEGGFGQDGPCNEDNPQNCELSHWAY